MREAAGKAIGKAFGDNIRLFSLITNTLAKDKEIEDTWRHHARPTSFRNRANMVEDEVVDALATAVRESYPRLSHRYYQMKAKWLGLPKLQHWDRNAPLPNDDDRLIAWPDATKQVLDAYGAFSPELASVGRQFFDKPWIDARLKPGKSGGAFAHPTVPSVHPYLLLNYHGKTRDVMTLAHELGHGVHQVLAGPQGTLMSHTPLTLAETASVFGEMLTFRSLLDAADSGAAPHHAGGQDRGHAEHGGAPGRVLPVRDAAARRAPVRRAAARADRRAMDAGADREPGAGVRVHAGIQRVLVLCAALHPLAVLRLCVCVRRLPGERAVFGVPGRAIPGFQAKYLDMLKAGGTKRHKELLAPFGLDASDPAFWNKGLDVISGFIDELEAGG